MALRLVLLVAATILMVTEARPRFMLVPLEDVRLVRHARSVPVYHRAQARSDQDFTAVIPARALPAVQEEAHAQASERYQRQSPGYGDNDHVDYGAYTGGYGAFGWYSDHPVCTNCGYGYH